MNSSRQATPKGNVNVTSNVKLDTMTDAKMGLDKEKTALKLGFTYLTEYTPEFAKIEIKGDLVVLSDATKAKKLLENWKKEKGKSLDTDFVAYVLNNIMSKCAVQALIISRELALPSPIPMPKINLKQGVEAPKKTTTKKD